MGYEVGNVEQWGVGSVNVRWIERLRRNWQYASQAYCIDAEDWVSRAGSVQLGGVGFVAE
jgi:hypothetical protein